MHADERGFTIIEVLVAASVLVVGVLALLLLLDSANAGTAAIRAREGATNLTRQVSEAARSVPYRTLTPASIAAELQAQPGLEPDGTSADWTIQRRGFEYDLAATVCSIDDPADGAGPHDVGAYCTDSATVGTADRNPDDYKRVTVDVSWTAQSSTRHMRQVVVVNNPGSAGGPAVRDLTVVPPATTVITSLLAGVGFVATTSSPATSIVFSVDGVTNATAGGNATSWTFAWNISALVDGTHLVTAQAFDAGGLSGATRSVTVTLNRHLPDAPTGFAAGFNHGVVDFEWLPNAERDIVGYRVYRVGSGALVCTLTRDTACQDTSPPPGAPSYFVVAVDLDVAGAHRNGSASPAIAIDALNAPPFPPEALTADEVDGAIELRWRPASPADDDGEGVAFYRIYRDGLAFADRYDRTGAAGEVTFVDGRTGGTAHNYWVTAVDARLAESAALGPVQR